MKDKEGFGWFIFVTVLAVVFGGGFTAVLIWAIVKLVRFLT